MSDSIWVSTTGNWASTASWSTGIIPISGDNAYFLSGSVSVTSGLDQSAVNNVSVHVGTAYRGSFGNSASDALDTGTGWLFNYDGRSVPQAFLHIGNSCSVIVRSTGDNSDALHIDGGGAAADVTVIASRVLTLAGSLTLADLFMLTPSAIATLKTGLTLVDAFVQGGVAICQAALTNIYMRGGRWTHEGPSTNNITLLEMSGGVFELNEANGCVISTLNSFGGLVDASGDKLNKTVTAGTVYAGGTVNLDNKADTITAALTRRGGRIIGGSNVTITEKQADIGAPIAA